MKNVVFFLVVGKGYGYQQNGISMDSGLGLKVFSIRKTLGLGENKAIDSLLYWS
jgi:hypothetical protein